MAKSECAETVKLAVLVADISKSSCVNIAVNSCRKRGCLFIVTHSPLSYYILPQFFVVFRKNLKNFFFIFLPDGEKLTRSKLILLRTGDPHQPRIRRLPGTRQAHRLLQPLAGLTVPLGRCQWQENRLGKRLKSGKEWDQWYC